MHFTQNDMKKQIYWYSLIQYSLIDYKLFNIYLHHNHVVSISGQKGKKEKTTQSVASYTRGSLQEQTSLGRSPRQLKMDKVIKFNNIIFLSKKMNKFRIKTFCIIIYLHKLQLSCAKLKLELIFPSILVIFNFSSSDFLHFRFS